MSAAGCGVALACADSMSWSVPVGVGLMLERRVSLFRSGHEQAVHIPREFELPGTQALMRQENGRLIVEPIGTEADGLLALLDRLDPIDEAFAEIADPPPEPVEL